MFVYTLTETHINTNTHKHTQSDRECQNQGVIKTKKWCDLWAFECNLCSVSQTPIKKLINTSDIPPSLIVMEINTSFFLPPFMGSLMQASGSHMSQLSSLPLVPSSLRCSAAFGRVPIHTATPSFPGEMTTMTISPLMFLLFIYLFFTYFPVSPPPPVGPKQHEIVSNL